MATPTNLPAAQTTGAVLTAAYMNDLRGAFRVLQVVNAIYSTAVTNNTNTFVDTGLTATITPQSNTSKILVIGHHNGLHKSSTNSQSGVVTALLRGATILTYPSTGSGYTNSNLQMTFSDSFSYLDSPATTSATTYKTQFANLTNASAVIAQVSQGSGFATSYITLMEISA